MSPKHDAARIAGLAILAALVAACGPEPGRQVILVLLDAARPDRFGCYGHPRDTTPQLDALAARGAVFERHFAQDTHTRGSLPALLYSRYFTPPMFPHSPSVPFARPSALFQRPDDESVSLPRAFAAGGFRTAAISAHVWLRAGTRFAEQFGELQNLASAAPIDRGYPRAGTVVGAAIDWIDRHRGEDFFLYLHLMDTHFPHFFEEDARALYGEDRRGDGRFDPGGEPVDRGRPLAGDDRRYLDALYDGSLRYADRELGRLIRHLERDGSLDHTTLAITSDHGEHLLEVAERFGHHDPWHDAVAHIPWLLFHPGLPGPLRVTSLTESVDLAPTLLDLHDVGLPEGARMDGRSLAPLLRGGGEPARFAFAERAVRGERFKCLFRTPLERLLGSPAPHPDEVEGDLYDLTRDPLETEDLWSQRPDDVRACVARHRARLRPAYQRFQAAVAHGPPPGPFAIASRDFELDGSPLELPRVVSAETLRAARSENGWLRSVHWETNWLLATDRADPLEVTFPLPDGAYAVTAHVRGRGHFELDDGTRVALEAAPLRPGDPVIGKAVAVGVARVHGERFRARLVPASNGSWFAITMLGFDPAGAAAEPESAAELERLRVLGYVQ